jgi:hypothetical protein
MAHSNDNVILQGAHGTFAKRLVFRQRFGQSILCKRPKKSHIPPTTAQSAIRERFLAATVHAKSVPDLLAMYRAVAKEGLSAYNVALADFFCAPDIRELDVSASSLLFGFIYRFFH